jgi:hypothetical protein
MACTHACRSQTRPGALPRDTPPQHEHCAPANNQCIDSDSNPLWLRWHAWLCHHSKNTRGDLRCARPCGKVAAQHRHLRAMRACNGACAHGKFERRDCKLVKRHSPGVPRPKDTHAGNAMPLPPNTARGWRASQTSRPHPPPLPHPASRKPSSVGAGASGWPGSSVASSDKPTHCE